MTPSRAALRRQRAAARSIRVPRLPWLWIAIGIVAVLVIAVARLASPSLGSPSQGLSAVVIDQLSPRYANETLRGVARDSFNAFGLDVREYEGEEVDVELYRNLGLADCGVCLIRSHSGILVLEGDEDEHITSLFTNEPYSRMKYVSEQLADRILVVRPSEQDSELTFGVSPLFITRSMEGQLPSTIVVVAGCSCLGRSDLATAFLSRGASVVVSWDRSVNLEYLDVATAHFLDGFFSAGLTLEEAVAATMAEFGSDPQSGATLTYFPVDAGRFTARELLR